MKHKEIENILEDYSLGRLLSYETLTQGFANENLRVKTTEGSVLLRVCKQQNIENILEEMKLMELLKKIHFPTAFPIISNHGSYIYEKLSYPVVIYNFITGNVPELNHETVKEVALAVSMLNMITDHEHITKKNSINLDACFNLIWSEDFKKCQQKKICEDFEDQIAYIAPFLKEFLPMGIIHGDVFPDNTLFRKNKLLAIIDFEEFAVDTLLWDVGMTINGFCYINNRIEKRLVKIFLKNYETVRKLTTAEKDLLPYYIQWAALGMASWHLKKLVLKDNIAQRKRIIELLARVDCLRNNPLTIYHSDH